MTWEELETWQKLLLWAIASWAGYYVFLLLIKVLSPAEEAITRFFYNPASNRQQYQLPHYVAAVSGNQIHITRPDKSAGSIELSDLRKVLVATNDSGPWGYDVWFVLEGSKNSLEFPLETHGLDKVLPVLKQLPGFELRGMNSASNARVECWPNPRLEPFGS